MSLNIVATHIESFIICFNGLVSEYHLCWDEENRLSALTDKGSSSRYFYDAGGERFLKLNGHYQSLNINGRWHTRLLFNNPTLYVSANLVVTPQGYTKHYYAGTERIASRIGEGIFEDHDQAPEDMLPYHENQYRKIQRDAEMLSEETGEVIKGQFDFLRGYAYPEFPFHGLSCFWYHPDHLGSSSWITNECGHAMQYLDYLPFGEPWINQRNTDWNARYTFSGKERDGETGYSYFGARYYDAELSIWLSVDPLAHKRPWESPYSYCGNNPVGRIDPTGMIWETPEDQVTANELTAKASEQRNVLIQQREGLSQIENRSKKQEGDIKSLNKKIDLLSRGIDRIKEMGDDPNRTYHFQSITGDMGGVRKRSDGVFDIEHNSNAMAFHEVIHIDDYRTNSFAWGFDKYGYLGTDYSAFSKKTDADNVHNNRELRAYRAQFLFDNKTLRYSNDGFQGVGNYVKNYSGIKEWMIINKIWR